MDQTQTRHIIALLERIAVAVERGYEPAAPVPEHQKGLPPGWRWGGQYLYGPGRSGMDYSWTTRWWWPNGSRATEYRCDTREEAIARAWDEHRAAGGG